MAEKKKRGLFSWLGFGSEEKAESNVEQPAVDETAQQETDTQAAADAQAVAKATEEAEAQAAVKAAEEAEAQAVAKAAEEAEAQAVAKAAEEAEAQAVAKAAEEQKQKHRKQKPKLLKRQKLPRQLRKCTNKKNQRVKVFLRA